jgi:phosphatidylglycerol:prolipoprotein diacylglycerol transferase
MRLLAAIHFPNIDPVMFHLGPIAVRWYGLSYLVGFGLCYLLLRSMIRRGILGLSPAALGDLMSWLVLGVLIGGRAGWWLVYHRLGANPEPWYAPIDIRQGGMSFHGGLIGLATVMLLWTRKKRAPLWNLLDCAALVAPIGLFLGRIANFINAELVGRPTNLPWGVIFPGESFARHPSQLYEAIFEGPLLLACLWATRALFHPKQGRLGAIFLILYGLFRFCVEFTRQPDDQLGFIAFGWLTMGQLLSFLLVLAGMLLYSQHRPQPSPPPAHKRSP